MMLPTRPGKSTAALHTECLTWRAPTRKVPTKELRSGATQPRVRSFNVCGMWHAVVVARFLSLLFLFIFCASPSRSALAQQTDPTRQAALKTLNTASSEADRLEAFVLLEQTGALDSKQISRSLCDTAPALRAAALRVGEGFAKGDIELELRLIALNHDRSALVQLQLLKSLPNFTHPTAAIALKKVVQALLKSSVPAHRSAAEAVAKTL
jgi:hypothetical protein